MMRGARAFTLIETLIVVALTALVMLALASLIQYFYKTNTATLLQWQAVTPSRTHIESAMAALREASTLSAATDSSLSFTIDTDGASQSLTYSLNDGTLAESGDASATIAAYIANDPGMPLFTYYDASGTELSAPVDPAQVASVLIGARIAADASVPGTTILSGAALRNLMP